MIGVPSILIVQSLLEVPMQCLMLGIYGPYCSVKAWHADGKRLYIVVTSGSRRAYSPDADRTFRLEPTPAT